MMNHMSTSTTSIHESAARTRKALALVQVLREGGVDASWQLSDRVKAAAVSVSGVNPPSAATWAMVATMIDSPPRLTLPQREDPFAGL